MTSTGTAQTSTMGSMRSKEAQAPSLNKDQTDTADKKMTAPSGNSDNRDDPDDEVEVAELLDELERAEEQQHSSRLEQIQRLKKKSAQGNKKMASLQSMSRKVNSGEYIAKADHEAAMEGLRKQLEASKAARAALEEESKLYTQIRILVSSQESRKRARSQTQAD